MTDRIAIVGARNQRAECPLCGREAPLTVRSSIGRHSSSDTRYSMCEGYKMFPFEARILSDAVLAAMANVSASFAMTTEGVADLAGVNVSVAWCALLGHENRGDVARRYEPYIVWHRVKVGGSEQAERFRRPVEIVRARG